MSDSSYGNTKLYVANTVPSVAAYGVSYPSYMQIGQAVGGYAGAIGGGIQGGVGGFTTLCSVNGGVYSEIFRACWNGCTMTTDLNMGTKTLTCGTLNCSSLTLGAPTFTGSTTVNQTAATLPTTGAQIGFLLKAKLSGLQATTGWLISTSAAAITNIAYTIPAIGMDVCV